MDGPKFVIEAAEAESMARESGLSLLQLLPTLVESAQTLARPPISNYHVGAVGLGSGGGIFFGVNLEFPGVPLHHSVHAEQFLITNLAAHGEHGLLALAVSAAPCGHCRQFLQELRRAADLQILITSSKPVDFKPLISMLPNPFGPFDLLNEQTPLLLEPHHNGLSLRSKIIPRHKFHATQASPHENIFPDIDTNISRDIDMCNSNIEDMHFETSKIKKTRTIKMR